MTLSVVNEQQLASAFNGVISQQTLASGIELLAINHPMCRARISLYAGQVFEWQPSQHQPVLWCSNDSAFNLGKAIRGGIPLCWPWFGPREQDAQHGFLRNNVWRLEDYQILPDKVLIELSISGNEYSPTWPYRFKVTQKLSLGEKLHQSLIIENCDEVAFEYSGALHTYFNVISPEHVALNALNHVDYLDKLTGETKRDGQVNGVGPQDRVFSSSETVVLHDKAGSRTIEIKASGHDSCVVWNPGTAVAKNMADMHEGAEQEFVCVEPALINPKTLEPAQTSTIEQTICVTKL